MDSITFFDPTMIRVVRKARKLTLAELGRRVGYSGKAISGWESGETRITAKDLAVLGNALQVPAQIFFKTKDFGKNGK